jgi:hypothetical protein
MSEKSNDLKAVFKAAVNERLAARPNQWAGEESASVTMAVITAISDKDGQPIMLSDDEKAIVELASRPTNKLQVQVLKAIVEKHGGSLSAADAALLAKVVGPTAFKLELIKAGRIKDTGAGGLKDLLD